MCLTTVHGPEMAARIKATVGGQAHWADPESGHTCRECVFWVAKPYPPDGGFAERTPLPYRAVRGHYDHEARQWSRPLAELRDRRCAMARKMAGRYLGRVPHDAASMLLGQLAEGLEHCGEHYAAEDWKCAFLKAMGAELRFMPALDGEGVVAIGYHSKRLDKEKFSELIERIYEYGARHGVEFHGPKGSEAA